MKKLLSISTAILLTACANTQTGGGDSKVTGSASQNGRRNAAVELPHCSKPLGTLALVEQDIPALAQLGLTSPIPVIRLMVAQSGCFTVVDRGQALSRIAQENALAGRKQKLVKADYFLTPDIITQNKNSGGFAGGLGALLPGIVGIVAGAVSVKKSEAQTALYLTDANTSVQVAAATGSAKTSDVSLGGFAGAGLAIGGMGGYSDTALGKTVAAAFLDAYAKLVRQLGGN